MIYYSHVTFTWFIYSYSSYSWIIILFYLSYLKIYITYILFKLFINNLNNLNNPLTHYLARHYYYIILLLIGLLLAISPFGNLADMTTFSYLNLRELNPPLEYLCFYKQESN